MQKKLLFVAFLFMAICSKVVAQDQLAINDFSLYSGGSREVSVTLTNVETYVGFQFDLYLPDGVTVEAFTADSNRIPEGTTPQMSQQTDGSYRFIAASLNGNPITGNEGAVMTITVHANDNMAEGSQTGYLRNVKISKADGSGVTVDEQPFTITVKGPEAYAVLDGTTLTFYYDTLKESRGGMSVGPFTSTDDVSWASSCESITNVVFDASMAADSTLTSTAHWFCYCSNLTAISGISNLNTNNVTDMNQMFYGCSGLTTLDVTNFNTANVTNMRGMFANCSGLTTLNVSNFNTANVINMNGMFSGCSGLTTLDVSNFNTANVASMFEIFNGCSSLQTIYVGSGWSTAQVTWGADMFTDCTNLVGGKGTTYNADHTDYTYAHIDEGSTNPGYLTSSAAPTSYTVKVTVTGNGEVSYGSTIISANSEQAMTIPTGENVELMLNPASGYKLESVKKDTIDVTSEVVATATAGLIYPLGNVYADYDITVTFVNDTKEHYAVLSNESTTLTFYYDKQKETRGGMSVGPFAAADSVSWASSRESITNVVFDASMAADSTLTSTAYWFDGCTKLTEISGISNLYTANVTNMNNMFTLCSGLTTLDVSSFNTANVMNMNGMFAYCSGLTNLDVSNFNTANVTNMYLMFTECSGLTTLDVSNFNTANVTNMREMFYGCSGLTTLDLSSFNTANVTYMSYMFSGCSGLQTIYVGSGWSTAQVTDGADMFTNCTNLVGGKGTTYNADHRDYTYAHIDEGSTNPGYLTSIADLADVAEVTFTRNLYELTLNCATPNVTIWYTMGTDSIANWQPYNQPITLTSDCTVRAYAVRPSGIRSAETSFTFQMSDVLKVNTPTLAWEGDVLTITSTTLDAQLFFQASQQDSTEVDPIYGMTPLQVTVTSDCTITTYAMKEGMLNSDSIVVDYPYTAWMHLLEAIHIGYVTVEKATGSSKVDQELLAYLAYYTHHATEMYASRTATRNEIESTDDEIRALATEILMQLEAEEEFSMDSFGVLRIHGNATLDEAFEAYGGRYEAAQFITSIIWDKETALTDDMLQGIDNPNLLIYVNSQELAPQNFQNIVVGDVAQEIVLSNKDSIQNNDFFCPRAFTAEHISYTRNFTQETTLGVSRGWETIALPFQVQSVEHETKGTLAPFENNASTLHFWLRQMSDSGLVRATQIEPYVPYLIAMPNDPKNYSEEYCLNGRVTFSATGATVSVTPTPLDSIANSSLQLVGTTVRVAQSEYVYALNVGQPSSGYLEGSVFERNSRDVRPFECYTLHYDENGARYITLNELSENGFTGIEEITFEGKQGDSWYTLDGKKLQKRPTAKGLYIHNGNKVVVK